MRILGVYVAYSIQTLQSDIYLHFCMNVLENMIISVAVRLVSQRKPPI